jgi:hypothetical protein
MKANQPTVSRRHYLRLDTDTDTALEELCRQLFTTKSELMRRYVRSGVQSDMTEYAEQAQRVRQSTVILSTF